MLKKGNYWSVFILAIPSTAAILMHGYLGGFSRFMADDYCSAYFAARFSLLRAVWYWYRTWSGGYSTSILDELLPLIGPGGIPYVTPIVLLIWLAASLIAILLLLPNALPQQTRLWISIPLSPMLVFTILLISPDIPQSLYWWVGMRAYVAPVLLSTIYIALYKWFEGKAHGPRQILIGSCVSFGLIFFNGGFSETFTPVQLAFLSFFILLKLSRRDLKLREPAMLFLLAGWLGALTSLITMIAAPGNANRQAFFPPPPGLFTILDISVRGFLIYLKSIFATGGRVAGLLSATLAAALLGFQNAFGRAFPKWIPPVTLIVGIVSAYACFPPAAFGFSDFPPFRTWILPSFILVASLLVFGYTYGELLARIWKLDRMQFAGLVLAVLALAGWSAWTEIRSLAAKRPEYVRVARIWDTVDEQIRDARANGQELVTIPIIPNWARLNTPNDNPKFWVTDCMSDFYGIPIRAVEDYVPDSD